MWALGKYVFTIKNVHAFRPSRLNECRPVLDIYGKCKPVMNSLQQWKPNSSVIQRCKNIRAVAIGGGGGGGRGGQRPPGPCWTRHIKSVDGSVFFRLSYFNYSDLQLFAIFIFEVDFSETYPTTSAENSVSEHPKTTLQGSWLRHSR